MTKYYDSTMNYDADLPDSITMDEAIGMVDGMLKEIFLAMFTRAFGEPDQALTSKVEQSNMLEIKDWMINLVDADKPEDIFISSLDRTLTQFVATRYDQKFDTNLSSNKFKNLNELKTHLNESIT